MKVFKVREEKLEMLSPKTTEAFMKELQINRFY
jgi:hypothetical protein